MDAEVIDLKEKNDELLSHVQKNIQRRRQMLSREEKTAVVVKNKIISEALHSIPGISKRLAHLRTSKLNSEKELVTQFDSHATITRGEVRRK